MGPVWPPPHAREAPAWRRGSRGKAGGGTRDSGPSQVRPVRFQVCFDKELPGFQNWSGKARKELGAGQAASTGGCLSGGLPGKGAS